MSSIILVLLTTIIAVLGTAIETRNQSTGKLKTGGWLIILLVIALGFVQLRNNYQKTMMDNQQRNSEILEEVKRHNAILNSVYLTSQPLYIEGISFEFELDLNNKEVENYLKKATNYFKREFDKNYAGVGFSAFGDLEPNEKEYPNLYILTHNAGFYCTITSKDSAKLLSQAGSNLPLPNFAVDFNISKDKIIIRYSDRKPSILQSDAKFFSANQLDSAKFEIEPIIWGNLKMPLLKLVDFDVSTRNGVRMRASRFLEPDKSESHTVYYRGFLSKTFVQ